MPRIPNKTDARRRFVVAARVALAATGEVTPQLIQDVCEQSGLHPAAYRTVFPTDEVLFDAVHDTLVEECADRLRSSVNNFVPPADRDAALVAAATCLALARPVDRGGLVIRNRRRLRALMFPIEASSVIRAERKFVGEVTGTLTQLMAKLGRRFAWDPTLAVRVILDTYERSFEVWLIGGGAEENFDESAYIRRTLPALMRRMSDLTESEAVIHRSLPPLVGSSDSGGDLVSRINAT